MPLGITNPDDDVEKEAKRAGLMNPNMSLDQIDPSTAAHIKNTILARRRKALLDKSKQLLTRKQAPGREQTLLSVRAGDRPQNLLGGS